MEYIDRFLESPLTHALHRGKSVLLLGPRQTGKTTLINRIPYDLAISFVQPDIRLKYDRVPGLLGSEVNALLSTKKSPPLVILDEIQRSPSVLDVVQDLIDRKKAQFILTGSSARKLRRHQTVNLLPGRVVTLHLDPLTIDEAPPASLQERLLFGSLPGLLRETEADKETDLKSYVTTYLEEEVRAEALVRHIGPFARFLELAASESGLTVHFRKLSQEIGVAHTTISDYYQVLEDCLIAERVDPFIKSKTRKKLTRASKYIFFDLGVRRVAANEGHQLSMDSWGRLFEQFVGLELIRQTRFSPGQARLRFWRDPAGPEIDWVLEQDNRLIPIEVKWTSVPSAADIKHMALFLTEYPQAKKGFLICQADRPALINNNIWALPWQQLHKVLDV